MVTTDLCCVDLLLAVLLDARFQVLFALGYFLHWNWRLPRPMKGAGNKAVLITGCDSGMGHMMARRFDEMKMVVFAGCSHPDGPSAKVLRQACSERLHVVPLDVTKGDQVQDAVAYVKANLPHGEKGLYCLVISARTPSSGCFDFVTTDMCDVTTDVMAAVRVTKYFLPLITKNRGRIVAINSILARLCNPGAPLYCASKHALDGFFSSLRYELKDSGVHVAIVETEDVPRTTDVMRWTQSHLEDMWKNLSAEDKISYKHHPEGTKKRIPLAPSLVQEQNYKKLLEDVEDAMLAEEPYLRYVSAPLATKAYLSFLQFLPEELEFKLTSSKAPK